MPGGNHVSGINDHTIHENAMTFELNQFQENEQLEILNVKYTVGQVA